jgi:hypothetical protein
LFPTMNGASGLTIGKSQVTHSTRSDNTSKKLR